MGQWVVSVAGIVILSVLCDVILPDGQTRKYIKTVIGIVVTVVMLQPIINLASNIFNVEESYSFPASTVEVQQSYLDMVHDKQQVVQLTNLKTTLWANGVPVSDIEIGSKKKIAVVRVDSGYSYEKEEQIFTIIKQYFPDYEISIEWS